jgi:hypothetical protein
MAELKCPHCGKLNTAATNLTSDTDQPYPGAASLCFECCEWGVFDRDGEELIIRTPTPTEYVQLSLDRDAQHLRSNLKWFKGMRN